MRALTHRSLGAALAITLGLGLGLGALAGCSDDKKGQPVVSLSGLSGGAAAPDVDGVLKAWSAAKLQVSAFDTVDGAAYKGGSCKGGTVSGVDVVLCGYGDAKTAQAAEAAGVAAVGETTGTSLSRDTLLLVVADRRKADPAGRTINQITKTFLGK